MNFCFKFVIFHALTQDLWTLKDKAKLACSGPAPRTCLSTLHCHLLPHLNYSVCTTAELAEAESCHCLLIKFPASPSRSIFPPPPNHFHSPNRQHHGARVPD